MHQKKQISPSIWAATAVLSFGGCAQAEPVSPSMVRDYTGIQLCADTVVHDLTTPEERDTTPGFVFHVQLSMTATCKADFERQIAAMNCFPAPLSASGCVVEDTSKYGTRRHTALTVRPMPNGSYDLRFWR